MKKILVTGGAGYIGSHTSLALLQAGMDVVVLDNLSKSSEVALTRVTQLAGRAPTLIRGDIRDPVVLKEVFADHDFAAVLHFAGLKSVGESVSQPLCYYDNNLLGTLRLCEAMHDAGVFTLVFSSSATVYGDPVEIPISEDHPVGRPTNPYGRSKLMIEQMLSDLCAADSKWRVALLRYFNPIGAHESGLIGEDPQGIPNNLLPFIAQVASGRLSELSVFGDDYDTVDGTGVRDYIHVVDLAEGHIKALVALENHPGVHIWNLGTGQGYSVLQMVKAFEAVSGKAVPHKVSPRRQGDVASCFTDPHKAKQELGWCATRGLSEMIRDAWRWQQQNPNGFL